MYVYICVVMCISHGVLNCCQITSRLHSGHIHTSFKLTHTLILTCSHTILHMVDIMSHIILFKVTNILTSVLSYLMAIYATVDADIHVFEAVEVGV